MTTTANTPPFTRVMSGMRPTGKLHLGHYWGVLHNWVSLQHQYPSFFMVADWHALTTKVHDTQALKDNTTAMVLDWLAAGVDPNVATVYVQSHVPQIAELALLLSMVTPVKWLETDPTLKDMVALLRASDANNLPEGSHLTHGLLGYPLLQTADILTLRADAVPVGSDQVAHLEVSRDIARRFNHTVGQPLFAEPKPLLTPTPLLTGLDGRKMGKSFDNAVFLSDTEADTLAKVKTAVTDPARQRKTDPGSPEACVAVFPLHQQFSSASEVEEVRANCTSAGWGCMACKQLLATNLNTALAPLRERRHTWEAQPNAVTELLDQGRGKAKQEADMTLAAVREALHLP